MRGDYAVVLLDLVNVFCGIDPLFYVAARAAEVSCYGDTIDVPNSESDGVSSTGRGDFNDFA